MDWDEFLVVLGHAGYGFKFKRFGGMGGVFLVHYVRWLDFI